MPDKVIIRTNEQPTIFNKEMVIGFLAFHAIGAVVGGFIGKNRMVREQNEGKRLDKPSFWNKEAAIGGLLGIYAGVLATFFLAAGIGGIAAAVIAGAGLIGLTLGGTAGKRHQEQEYAQAVTQQRNTQVDRLTSPMRDLSPELEGEQVQSRHFTSQIELERKNSPSQRGVS
jgi:hypothetical protein